MKEKIKEFIKSYLPGFILGVFLFGILGLWKN